MIIYESTTTDFDNLGLGKITPSSCVVTEELNGQYSLSLSHPIDNEGRWEKLQQDRIIKAPTHDGDQLFRLYKPVKNSKTGMIDVSALHIFYDLYDNLIEDTRPTAKNGQEAGNIILGGCQYSTSFTFSSNISAVSTAYYIRKNPVEAFIGSEDQSFINRWGGEIRRNNFTITINGSRGADLGMKISYRKNLAGVEMSSDTSRVVTRILPTALDENGVIFYTTAKYYNSSHIGDYPHPKIGVLNTGIRVGQEVDGSVPYATESAAKTAMASMAAAAFAAGVDMPEVSVSVDYINLGDTDEYSAYKDVITQAHIGDTVTLEHPTLGIDVSLRVVKIEWDAAVNRVKSIVLGSQSPNFAKSVVSSDIDLSSLKDNQPTNLQENGNYSSVYINHEDGFKAVLTDGTYTQMNGSGVKSTHLDGSYSLMTGSGFKHYDATGDRDYHYLMAVGTGSGTDSNTVTIQLPSNFVGKEFSVSLGIQDFKGNTYSTTPGVTALTNGLVRLGVSVTNYDYVNGRFTVSITCWESFLIWEVSPFGWDSYGTGNSVTNPVTFSYLAIA